MNYSIPKYIKSEYNEVERTVEDPYTNIKIRQKSEEDYIALDGNTGIATWGPKRQKAIQNIKKDIDIYSESSNNRSCSIVETDDTLGGDPRVDGTRIGVVHIYAKLEDSDSLADIASRFSGILTISEVDTAVQWIENNSERVNEINKRKQLFSEYVQEEWSLKSANGVTTYSPSDPSKSFEEWKESRTEDSK